MKNSYEEFEEKRRELEEVYDKSMGIFGLSKGAFMVIYTLYSLERPCTQKEICEDWHENKQTVNSAVKKLIEEGIIDIAPSPENLREKLLTFTEKGKFLAMRTVKKLIDAEKTAFGKLTEEEQKEAARITGKFCKLLKKEFEKTEGENK
ncbi:MAG: MarR family transcriptional regulator [Oscillospiraceae bacterium]|nr:MarR family transcriptional regulator [Oscillospiraceae bacterium]